MLSQFSVTLMAGQLRHGIRADLKLGSADAMSFYHYAWVRSPCRGFSAEFGLGLSGGRDWPCPFALAPRHMLTLLWYHIASALAWLEFALETAVLMAHWRVRISMMMPVSQPTDVHAVRAIVSEWLSLGF